MKFYEYEIKTTQFQCFIDLTNEVLETINRATLKNGRLTLFCPHTTAGITINENADPDVIRDMIVTLDKVYPIKGDYKHYEGNSHAHLKSSTVGVDQTILVKDKKPVLGIWQSPYFCEFDGPRTRKLIISVEGE